MLFVCSVSWLFIVICKLSVLVQVIDWKDSCLQNGI